VTRAREYADLFGGRQMRIKVLKVKLLSPPSPVGFIVVRNRTLTPLAERFIDYARKVANSDGDATKKG
jgi:hypothetical protein